MNTSKWRIRLSLRRSDITPSRNVDYWRLCRLMIVVAKCSLQSLYATAAWYAYKSRKRKDPVGDQRDLCIPEFDRPRPDDSALCAEWQSAKKAWDIADENGILDSPQGLYQRDRKAIGPSVNSSEYPET